MSSSSNAKHRILPVEDSLYPPNRCEPEEGQAADVLGVGRPLLEQRAAGGVPEDDLAVAAAAGHPPVIGREDGMANLPVVPG